MYEDLEPYDFSEGAELPTFDQKIEIPVIDIEEDNEEKEDDIDFGFLL